MAALTPTMRDEHEIRLRVDDDELGEDELDQLDDEDLDLDEDDVDYDPDADPDTDPPASGDGP